MTKPNSTVILNHRSCVINNYLAKGFYIIIKGSNKSIMIPNDVRLRIILIDQIDTDFVMAKNEAISSVENIIKKLHIQKNMYLI